MVEEIIDGNLKKVAININLIGGIGNKIGDVLRPRLTTVEMPLFEMGRRAGEQILELISGQKMSCEKSKAQDRKSVV